MNTDKEFERELRDRLSSVETTPPLRVWEGLEKALAAPVAETQPAKKERRLLWLPWSSAAAVVLLAVGITLRTGNEPIQDGSRTASSETIPSSSNPATQPAVQSVSDPAVELASTNRKASSTKYQGITPSRHQNKDSITPMLPLRRREDPYQNYAQMKEKREFTIPDNLAALTPTGSNTVVMTGEEFLEFLRQNGMLNQQISTTPESTQTVAQSTPAQPTNPQAQLVSNGGGKRHNDLARFLLRRFSNGNGPILVSEQDSDRINVQVKTPVFNVNGNYSIDW